MRKYTRTVIAAGLALSWIANSNAAVNLVPNGDFETAPYNPPVSFTSDYTLADGTANSLVPESTFLVGTSPSLYHPLFSSYFDHTLGTANGHMFIGNGSSDTTDQVWKTAVAIPVTPNTDYFFEAFMSSAHPDSPAILSFIVDGDVSDAVLGSGNAPAATGVWQGVSQSWNSGANTSVLLYLQNANSAFQGNDFAIDDINFSETSIVHTPDSGSTMAFAGIGFAACVLANRRFRRVSA
jgi:hypothetical protein